MFGSKLYEGNAFIPKSFICEPDCRFQIEVSIMGWMRVGDATLRSKGKNMTTLSSCKYLFLESLIESFT